MPKGIMCPSKKKKSVGLGFTPHVCFWKANSKLSCGRKQHLQIPVLAFPYFRGKGWTFLACSFLSPRQLQSLCHLPISSPAAASSPFPALKLTTNILTELRWEAITLSVLLARLRRWQPLGLPQQHSVPEFSLEFLFPFLLQWLMPPQSLQALEKNLLAWAEGVIVMWSPWGWTLQCEFLRNIGCAELNPNHNLALVKDNFSRLGSDCGTEKSFWHPDGCWDK